MDTSTCWKCQKSLNEPSNCSEDHPDGMVMEPFEPHIVTSEGPPGYDNMRLVEEAGLDDEWEFEPLTDAELAIVAAALQHYYTAGHWPSAKVAAVPPKYLEEYVKDMSSPAQALFLRVRDG